MRGVKQLLIALGLSLPGAALAQAATVHLTPWCGCCGAYVKYLSAHGYDVETVEHEDMAPIRRQHGVSDRLSSCHTTLIGPYAIEGHVPVEVIDKLFSERPLVRGIALPAMPAGSPGMPGPKREPFTVYYVAAGDPVVFMHY